MIAAAPPDIWCSWPEHDLLFERLRQTVRLCGTAQDGGTAWAGLSDIGAWAFAIPLSAGGLEFGHGAIAMVCEEVGASTLPLPVVDTAMAGLLATATASAGPGAVEVGTPVVMPGRLPSPLGPPQLFLDSCRQGSGHRLSGTVGPVAVGVAPEVALLVGEGNVGWELWAVPTAAEQLTVLPVSSRDADAVAKVVVDGVRVDDSDALLRGQDGAGVLADIGIAVAVYQAALLSGLAAAALTALVERLRRRRQFGRSLSEHQSPRLRTAALLARLDVLRLAVTDAAAVLDRDALTSPAAAGVVALAAETALEISREALHLHGASGLRSDATAARCYRRIAWEALRCGPLPALWQAAAGANSGITTR